jgi:hypothetical protein
MKEIKEMLRVPSFEGSSKGSANSLSSCNLSSSDSSLLETDSYFDEDDGAL